MLKNERSRTNSVPCREEITTGPAETREQIVELLYRMSQDDLDGILTNLQTQDKIVTSNPLENKAKEFKDIACGTPESKNFIATIEATAIIQEWDEKHIPYKNKLSCLTSVVDKYAAGNENTYIDYTTLTNCFLNLPEVLLERFYQEHFNGDLAKMNWANELKKASGLPIEVKQLINPGSNARAYWYLSAKDLIKFIYQSSKHFGDVLDNLPPETLKKINNIDKHEVTEKGNYQEWKYHEFLHECFSYLLDILAEVDREMTTIRQTYNQDTRFWLVPATKELLTIIMGEVDPTNFTYKRNFDRKELQNLEEKIDGEIKKKFGRRSNYRKIIVATCKRMELQSQSSNNGASVFVSNLHYFTTKQELGDAFARYGFVKSVDIKQDKKTGKSKGVGFVRFFDLDRAEDAIWYMDGKDLRGRPLRVSASVFVDNLYFSTKDQELEDAFAIYGNIRSVNIIRDWETGNCKGFGYVEFANLICAAKAIRCMHGKKIRGRPLSVSWAQ